MGNNYVLYFAYKHYLFTSCKDTLDANQLFNLKIFHHFHNPFKNFEFY